ncbi:hypothetical protein QBC33DRAFT_588266 [Phialemonium atrogriseum]|uniref:Amidohydrolase-related domain-containing protein n=1 Tax=Phialemonium atrogriseum TaxID=1093897 RepID=A0AAJ0BZ17_9PEZI|nr:uncharacterized protein QBC33DRAFT_588266 [Phialemonium atrogriseum]KAK1766915.1 hypothetical protein QBC33DRAFT_588266 [Phialemonium atrogriseum]
MHVFDPDAYPLSPEAAYTPKPHTLPSALAFESSLGLDNIVLVQPSVYGTDNTCLLDALHCLGPRRTRAVVALSPATTSPSTLRAWHAAGVRAVRINLVSPAESATTTAITDLAAAAQHLLRTHADAVRPLGWAVQLYVPLALLDALEPLVPGLGVRVVVDHMGQPPAGRAAADPYDMPGFAALVRLMRGGRTFVKLSAPYRISGAGAAAAEEGYADVEPVARELLRVGGRRSVVFATDWPHTRFEGLDVRPWVEKVLGTCGDDDELVGRVFRGDAEDLWDARPGGE